MKNSEKCVCCGEIIPEGRMVCPKCEQPKAPKMIFVCSPYRGEMNRNIFKALTWCRAISLHGDIPIAPHLYFPNFLFDEQEKERKIGIESGKQLMLLCHEMWVIGSEISDGMAEEIAFAEKNSIPIKYK